ncbi:Hypothetical protein CAP_6910 [Chondromyces apiculatus DSM 436]|uniref:Uncharacterized protein n=1 Tax=Chondromyces apiculatus DSM 436 TaxID=1192034 RepID=A0A017TF15_9BACT|nr:Hypothetical protein CAP_6910 [Chondromyces apiculatus DSM 436]
MRRLAPLLLVLGLFIIVGPLLRQTPREHEVELRLATPDTIVGVELTWFEGDESGSQEPLAGGSWRFTQGQAPRSLSTPVRLPDGSYSLEIIVDRTSGRDSARRSIVLGDAERITVPTR